MKVSCREGEEKKMGITRLKVGLADVTGAQNAEE